MLIILNLFKNPWPVPRIALPTRLLWFSLDKNISILESFSITNLWDVWETTSVLSLLSPLSLMLSLLLWLFMLPFSISLFFFFQLRKLFHDGDPYNLEISRLICSANQWTGFYMIGASVIKELTEISVFFKIQSTKVSN